MHRFAVLRAVTRYTLGYEYVLILFSVSVAFLASSGRILGEELLILLGSSGVDDPSELLSISSLDARGRSIAAIHPLIGAFAPAIIGALGVGRFTDTGQIKLSIGGHHAC